MQVEICKHKVILTHNTYYMAIWENGTIHESICFPKYLKVDGFTTEELRMFDLMFKSFINNDY